jgi:lysozyme family protein
MANNNDALILKNLLENYLEPKSVQPTTQSKSAPTGDFDLSAILDSYVTKGTGMFDDFVGKVLKHEGGYTVDQGGPTMRGVTWRDNAKELSELGYSEKTLKNLTADDATKVYKKKYFDAPKLNLLPDDLQYVAFDYSVNSGPSRAIKSLQKIVGAKTDGIMGRDTLARIQAYKDQYGAKALQHAYVDERKEFLKGLAMKDPKRHGGSLKGWMNRIASLKRDIVNEGSTEA